MAIKSTHVGSLPRTQATVDMIFARENGMPYDADAFAAQMTAACDEVVRRQVEAGIDIVSDGEVVGNVTSGTISPTLGFGVALGYVPVALSKADTSGQIDARGKLVDAVVQRPPFYTEGTIRR